MTRFLLILFAGLSCFAAEPAYVAVSWDRGVVRVSGNGTVEHVSKERGHGIAVDHNGDYVVSATSKLIRVPRGGGPSSVIVMAPPGSQFLKVVIDRAGDFIVCDNRQHAVWRVKENGEISLIARYPAPQHNLESVELSIEPNGDFLLLYENGGTQDFRITPAGQMIPIPLGGDRLPRGWSIAPDGSGGYLVTGLPDQIFRLSATGDARLLRTLPGLVPVDAIRDPETGDWIVACGRAPGLLRMSADGSRIDPFLKEPLSDISTIVLDHNR